MPVRFSKSPTCERIAAIRPTSSRLLGRGFATRRRTVSIVFRNTGTATAPAFDAASTNPFGLAAVSAQAHPAFADIDGDGDLDRRAAACG